MDFSLSSEQRQLCKEVERFAVGLNEGLAQRESKGGLCRDAWQRCADHGLTGLSVSKEYGGGGHGALTTALALEAFGRSCEDNGLVFSVAAHLLAGAVPLQIFGNTSQKSSYLPDLCSGQAIAALAMTEASSGSDAYALESRAAAVGSGDGYRLNGRKTWITNAPVADLLIVGALDEATESSSAVSAFLVRGEAQGVRRGDAEPMVGLHTAAVGDVELEDVQLGSDALLGRPGGGSAVFQTAMDWERTCLFAAHVGTVERLLNQTVRFVKQRQRGGRRLSSHQAIAHQLADLKMQLEAARLLVYRAAWQIDRGRSATQQASIAKLFASHTLLEAAVRTLRLHGGDGLRRGGPLERTYRDAVAATLYSGTSEIQRNLIAAFLGLR